MKLNEAYAAVIDAIEVAVVAAKEELGIEEVVRGDRARPRPPTPCVWIFSEPAMVDHSKTTNRERWKVPVILAAIVKEEEPEDGYANASDLAAQVRSKVLADRTLGIRAVVQDVQSNRFEPSAPWHNEGNLYASVAVVDVIFLVKE